MATTTHGEQLLATEPDALRRQALERLKKRRDFKTHLLVYVLINTLLWGIWAVIGVSSHSWWPWAAAVSAAWGVGLAAHGFDVYVRHGSIEAEVREEMARLSQPRR